MASSVDLTALARRESEQVEWKENVADINDVVATITAFANDISNLGGGYVICGAQEVTDAHGFQSMRMTGLTASRLKEIEGKVLAACQRHVTPPVVPLVEVLPAETEDRRLLVFTVPATAQAHQFRRGDDGGRYYVRLSHRTVEARNGLLRELLVRKGPRQPWDSCCHPRAMIDDIDLIAFRDFLQQLGLWRGNSSLDHYLDPANQASPFVPSFCDAEPLTGTIRPRNFTLLLVGHNVQRFYPHAHAIFSMYPGVDRSEPFAERMEIAGTLIAQARRLIERLNTEAVMVMDKSSGAPPNAQKYPQRALHEAVVNALVHRDYEAVHPVRVTAFSDRIEVFSPGPLPSAVDPEVFRSGAAAPVWRNQALAWFLVKLNLAQAEGQGIATILRTMRDEGCPAPRFRLTPGSIECVLPAHPRHQVLRDLQAAEKLLTLGRIDEAARLIEGLLAADAFNIRVIALFCEIYRVLRPERVLTFVQGLGQQVSRLPDTAKLVLANVLSAQSDDHVARSVARDLMRSAAQGHLAEHEARQFVIGFLRVKDEEQAWDVLQRAYRHHPEWAGDPVFLQLEGRTLLQFAKRCSTTARRHRSMSAQMRSKAWDECRSYLDRAEGALKAALTRGPDPVVRDLAEDDLRFALKLREQARPPDKTS